MQSLGPVPTPLLGVRHRARSTSKQGRGGALRGATGDACLSPCSVHLLLYGLRTRGQSFRALVPALASRTAACPCACPGLCADLASLSGTTSSSSIVLYVPCAGRTKSHCSKEPWFTFLQSPTTDHKSGTTLVHGCRRHGSRPSHVHVNSRAHGYPSVHTPGEARAHASWASLTLNPRVPSGFLSC